MSINAKITNNTEVKNWTIKQIAEALKDQQKGNVKIEIPKFQRNLVWAKEQKRDFIDSLKRGYPIGTLLFYESPETDIRKYSLIDGLQRSSTIKEFVERPTDFFDKEDLDDDTINNLYNFFSPTLSFEEFENDISSKIQNYITSCDWSDKTNIHVNLARNLAEEYKNLSNSNLDNFKLIEIVHPFINKFISLYEAITEINIPILVFAGDETELPTVFERINNNGTQLGKYQIYAASWAVKNYTITVKNKEIINTIINKYESFIEQGYSLQDYDRSEIENTKTITIFEYALGFGKHICKKYPELFEDDESIQKINQVGFELLNACFGKKNSEIKHLNELLHDVDINKLEECVIEAIEKVKSILHPYLVFKGNARSKKANKGNTLIYHSQNQIISIIACTFREMYDLNDTIEIKKIDLTQKKATWKERENNLDTYIPQHYIFDIIAKSWFEGGFNKVSKLINENKYLQPIEKKAWDSKLDDWFYTTLARREKLNVKSARLDEKLFLNYIYVSKFSAYEQNSQVSKFDIEHLATKDQLKKIITKYNWDGLPISSIGNICLLPEYDNRKKKANTIYQDESYIKSLQERNLTIKDIEEKYTFTEKNDLDWLNEEYCANEYVKFFENYKRFLTKHFNKMKEKFYEQLDIK